MKIIIFIFLFVSNFICAQIDDSLTLKRDTFEYFSILDTNINKYKLPDTFVNSKWKDGIFLRKQYDLSQREYYHYGYDDSLSKTVNLSYILSIIDSSRSYNQVALAKLWCIDNFQKVFPFLVVRLSEKIKVGLWCGGSIIIWDRVGTGECVNFGEGMIIREVLFTIAGRASWILNELPQESFAAIRAGTTKEQSEDFKLAWLNYLNDLKSNLR